MSAQKLTLGKARAMWTEDKLSQLQDLWPCKEYSARDIARILGMTKNQVHGMGWRLFGARTDVKQPIKVSNRAVKCATSAATETQCQHKGCEFRAVRSTHLCYTHHDLRNRKRAQNVAN